MNDGIVGSLQAEHTSEGPPPNCFRKFGSAFALDRLAMSATGDFALQQSDMSPNGYIANKLAQMSPNGYIDMIPPEKSPFGDIQ